MLVMDHKRRMGPVRRADSGPSQTPPYVTGLVDFIAPWSTMHAAVDLTGSALTANSSAVGSVSNPVAPANYTAAKAADTTRPTLITAGGPNDLRFLRFDGSNDFMQSQAAMVTAGFWEVLVCKPPFVDDGFSILSGTNDGSGVLDGYFVSFKGTDNHDSLATYAKTATDLLTWFGKTSSWIASEWVIAAAGYQASTENYSLNGVDQTPYDHFTYVGTGVYAPSAQPPALGNGVTTLGAAGTFPSAIDVQFRLIFDHLPSAGNRALILAWLASWTGIE